MAEEPEKALDTSDQDCPWDIHIWYKSSISSPVTVTPLRERDLVVSLPWVVVPDAESVSDNSCSGRDANFWETSEPTLELKPDGTPIPAVAGAASMAGWSDGLWREIWSCWRSCSFSLSSSFNRLLGVLLDDRPHSLG